MCFAQDDKITMISSSQDNNKVEGKLKTTSQTTIDHHNRTENKVQSALSSAGVCGGRGKGGGG